MALTAGFKATMDVAVADKSSADYDATIKAEIDGYTARFGKTAGYTAPNAKLLKAVIFIESGGPSKQAWSKRVMQIGNPNDQALPVLKGGREGASVIMSVQLKIDLASKSIEDPVLNVRAGIAYAMTRAARFSTVVQLDSPDEFAHKAKPGESLSVIARREGTTVADIKASNPNVGAMIHPGQVVNFHHSHMTSVVTGWRTIDADFMQNRYNGGGDSQYAEKLTYVLSKL